MVWRFLGCGGLDRGLHQIFDKTFRNIDAEMDIRRTVGCQIKEQWKKIEIYIIK
jgi:hypothetical protein